MISNTKNIKKCLNLKFQCCFILVVFILMLNSAFATDCEHSFDLKTMKCETCEQKLDVKISFDGKYSNNSTRLISSFNTIYISTSANPTVDNSNSVIRCKAIDENNKVLFDETLTSDLNTKVYGTNEKVYQFNPVSKISEKQGKVKLCAYINETKVAEGDYFLYHRHQYNSETFKCMCGNKFELKNLKFDDMSIVGKDEIFIESIPNKLSFEIDGINAYFNDGDMQREIEVKITNKLTNELYYEISENILTSLYQPEGADPYASISYELSVLDHMYGMGQQDETCNCKVLDEGTYKFEIYYMGVLVADKTIVYGNAEYVENTEDIEITEDTKSSFSDLSNSHWAFDVIEDMVEKGIVSGYEDNTFKPNNSITRAEAAKLLMVTLRASNDYTVLVRSVSDVPITHWANSYVFYAQNYISTYSDGSFKPEQKITRLEFCNALGKILNVDYNKEFTNTFNDTSSLDETSKQNINKLVNLKIINGYDDGTFKPYNELTRAEVCKMLSFALKVRNESNLNKIAQTEGWQIIDPETGWISKAKVLEDNVLKIKDHGYEIYYNREFVTKLYTNVETIYEEACTTKDGKKWTIKWLGDDVVEVVKVTNQKWRVIDHYNNLSMDFESEYISEDEAKKLIKYFINREVIFSTPYSPDNLYYNIYEVSEDNVLQYPAEQMGIMNKSYKENNVWKIHLDDIKGCMVEGCKSLKYIYLLKQVIDRKVLVACFLFVPSISIMWQC